MVKKGLIVIILFIVCALVLKDPVLKTYLIYYLEDELGGICTIEKAHLLFKGIEVKNLQFLNRSNEIDFELKKGIAKFNFAKALKPRIYQIIFEGASFQIENLKSLEGLSKDKPNAPSITTPRALITIQTDAFSLDLNNAAIKLKDPGNVEAVINFSFKGEIKDKKIEEIKSFTISKGNLQSKRVALSGLNLKKSTDKGYQLTIPQLKIKDKKVGEVVVPLSIDKDRVVLERAPQGFFGLSAYLEGAFELNNFKNTCLHLHLDDCSFSNILNLVDDKDKVVLKGLFDGNITFCFKGIKISKLQGAFYNQGGGFTRIKRGASLDFLRKWLDLASYDILINNFKNYRYNNGEIAIRKENDNLILAMYFDSYAARKRNVIVNFHNLFRDEE